MSSVVIAGDTSGTVSLTAPAVAGTTVLTLPATSGTVVTDTATQTLTNKTLTSPVTAGTPTGVGVLTSGTAVASTSGTSIDFTGIPSWVKRITVMFSGVSTNGTSNPMVQLGDSGGIETSGYSGAASSITSTVSSANFTVGFGTSSTSSAALIRSGFMTIVLVSPNQYIASGSMGREDASGTLVFGGSKTLSDVLTQIRITTVNGTDTFDAGSINILYE